MGILLPDRFEYYRDYVRDTATRIVHPETITQIFQKTWHFFYKGLPFSIRAPVTATKTSYATITRLYELSRPLPLPEVDEIEPRFFVELRALLERHFAPIGQALRLPTGLDQSIKRVIIEHLVDTFAKQGLEHLPIEVRRNLKAERLENIDSAREIIDLVQEFSKEIGHRLFIDFFHLLVGKIPDSLKKMLLAQGIEINPFQQIDLRIEQTGETSSLSLYFTDSDSASSSYLQPKELLEYSYHFEDIPHNKFNAQLLNFFKLVEEGDLPNHLFLSAPEIVTYLEEYFGQRAKLTPRTRNLQHTFYSNSRLMEVWLHEAARTCPRFSNQVDDARTRAVLFHYKLEFWRFLYLFRETEKTRFNLKHLENEVRHLKKGLLQIQPHQGLMGQNEYQEYETTLQDIDYKIAAYKRNLAREQSDPERKIERFSSSIPPVVAQGLHKIFSIAGKGSVMGEALMRGCEKVLGPSSSRFIEAIKYEYELSRHSPFDLNPIEASYVEKILAVSLSVFTAYAVGTTLAPLLNQAGLHLGVVGRVMDHWLSHNLAKAFVTATLLAAIPPRYTRIYQDLCDQLIVAIVPHIIYHLVRISVTLEQIGLYALIERIEILRPVTSCLITQQKIQVAREAIEQMEAQTLRSAPLDFSFGQENEERREGEPLDGDNEIGDLIESFERVEMAREDLQTLLDHQHPPAAPENEAEIARVAEDSLLNRLQDGLSDEERRLFTCFPKQQINQSNFAEYMAPLKRVIELHELDIEGEFTTSLENFCETLEREVTQENLMEGGNFVLKHLKGGFAYDKIISHLSALFPDIDFSSFLIQEEGETEEAEATETADIPPSPIQPASPTREETLTINSLQLGVRFDLAKNALEEIEKYYAIEEELLEVDNPHQLIQRFHALPFFTPDHQINHRQYSQEELSTLSKALLLFARECEEFDELSPLTKQLNASLVFTLILDLHKTGSGWDLCAHQWQILPIAELLHHGSPLGLTYEQRTLMSRLLYYWRYHSPLPNQYNTRTSSFNIFGSSMHPGGNLSLVNPILPTYTSTLWRTPHLNQSDARYSLLYQILEQDKELQTCLDALFPEDRDKQLIVLAGDHIDQINSWCTELDIAPLPDRISLLPEALRVLRSAHYLLNPGASTVSKMDENGTLVAELRVGDCMNPSLKAVRQAPINDLLFVQQQEAETPHRRFDQVRAVAREDFERFSITDAQDLAAQNESLVDMLPLNPTEELQRFIGLLQNSLLPEQSAPFENLIKLFRPDTQIYTTLNRLSYKEFETLFMIIDRHLRSTAREERVVAYMKDSRVTTLFFLSQILKGHAIRRFPEQEEEILGIGMHLEKWQMILSEAHISTQDYKTYYILGRALPFIDLKPPLSDKAVIARTLLHALPFHDQDICENVLTPLFGQERGFLYSCPPGEEVAIREIIDNCDSRPITPRQVTLSPSGYFESVTLLPLPKEHICTIEPHNERIYLTLEGVEYDYYPQREEGYLFFYHAESKKVVLFSNKDLTHPTDKLTVQEECDLTRGQIIDGKLMEEMSDDFPQTVTLKWFASEVHYYKPLCSDLPPTKLVLIRKDQTYSFSIREGRAYYDSNSALFLSTNQQSPLCETYGSFLCLENALGEQYALIDFFPFTVTAGSTVISSRFESLYSRQLPPLLELAFGKKVAQNTTARIVHLTPEGFDLSELDFTTAMHMTINAYFRGERKEAIRYLSWAKQLQHISPLTKEELLLLFQFIFLNLSITSDEDPLFFLSIISIYFQNVQLFMEQEVEQERDYTLPEKWTAGVALYSLFLYAQYVNEELIDDRLLSEPDELMLFEFSMKSFLQLMGDEQAVTSITGGQQETLQLICNFLMSPAATLRLDHLRQHHDSEHNKTDILTSFVRQMIARGTLSNRTLTTHTLERLGLPEEFNVRGNSIVMTLLKRAGLRAFVATALGYIPSGTSLEETIQPNAPDFEIPITDRSLSERNIQRHLYTLVALAADKKIPEVDATLFCTRRKELAKALVTLKYVPRTAKVPRLALLRQLFKNPEAELEILEEAEPEILEEAEPEILEEAEAEILKEIGDLYRTCNWKRAQTPHLSNKIAELSLPPSKSLEENASDLSTRVRSELSTLPSLNNRRQVIEYLVGQGIRSLSLSLGILPVAAACAGEGLAAQDAHRAIAAEEAEFDEAALIENHLSLEKELFEQLGKQDKHCYARIFELMHTHLEISSHTPPSPKETPKKTSIAPLLDEVREEIARANTAIAEVSEERANKMNYDYKMRQATLEGWNAFIQNLSQLRNEMGALMHQAQTTILSLAAIRNKNIRFEAISHGFVDYDFQKICKLLDLPENSQFVKHIYRKFYFYFLYKSHYNRLECACEIAHKGPSKMKQVARFLTEQRYYSFTMDIEDSLDRDRIIRAFLLFEAQTGMILRSKQITQTLSVLEAANQSKRICGQYIPGMGKTVFYDAWNLFVKWQKGRLPVLVIPKSLIASTKESLGKQFFSVFGKNLHYIPLDRNTCQPRRLKQILHLIKKCRLHGDALLFDRQGPLGLVAMLKVVLYEKVHHKTSPIKKQQISLLCKILYQMQRFGYMTGDEGHQLYDNNSELNYPVGEKQSLPTDQYAVMEQVMLAFAKILKVQGMDIRHFSLPPEVYDGLKQALALQCIALPLFGVNEEKREALLPYLVGTSRKLPAELNELDEQHKDRIYLLRGMLCKLLPHAIKTRSLVEWGASNHTKAAIPYVGSNSPEEDSMFRLPYITALLTYFIYYERGLSREEVHELREDLVRKIEEESNEGVDEEDSRVVARLNQYCKTKNSRLEEFPDDLLKNNLHVITYYVSTIASKEITYYLQNATCPASALGELFYHSDVVTGTPGRRSTYPIGTELIEDHETIGKSLFFLLKKFAAGTSWMSPIKNDPIDFIVEQLRNPNVYAIIDEAAIFQESVKLTNLQASKRLLTFCKTHRPQIKGSVFYDADQQLKVLQSSGSVVKSSDDNSIPKARITLYDQVHTFGANVIQPSNAIGLLTVGTHTTKSSFVQALWRLRQFDKDQNIIILLTPQVCNRMIRQGVILNLDGLVNYLFAVSKEQNIEANFPSDMKKMESEVELAVLREICRTSSSDDAAALFERYQKYLLSPSMPTLEELFGRIEEDKDPRQLIDDTKENTIKFINQMEEVGEDLKGHAIEQLQDLPENTYPDTVASKPLNLSATVRVMNEVQTTEVAEEHVTACEEEEAMRHVQEHRPPIPPLPTTKWEFCDVLCQQDPFSIINLHTVNYLKKILQLQLGEIPIFSMRDLFIAAGNESMCADEVLSTIPEGLYTTGNLIPALQTRLVVGVSHYGIDHWKKPCFHLLIKFFYTQETNELTFYTIALDQYDFQECQRKINPVENEHYLLYDIETDAFTNAEYYVGSLSIEDLRASDRFRSHLAALLLFNCNKRVLPTQKADLEWFFDTQVGKSALPAWRQALSQIREHRQLSSGQIIGAQLIDIRMSGIDPRFSIF